MSREGLYWSRYDDEGMVFAFKRKEQEELAHFGIFSVPEVIKAYLEAITEWSYCESKEKYMIMPDELLRW